MSDYTGHTEYRALLAGIIAQPDDDLPRLVLCDWLEEMQQDDATARAEFIRLQVERAKNPGRAACDRCRNDWQRVNKSSYPVPMSYCPSCRTDGPFWPDVVADLAMRHRMSKLLHADVPHPRGGGLKWSAWESWLGFDRVQCPDGYKWFRRGFVSEWHGPLAVWCGVECHQCAGVGRAFPITGPSIPCRRCGGSLVTGIGPQLVRSQPVERVVVTDRHADVSGPPDGPNRHWRWVNADRGDELGGYQQFTLPGWLFALMTETFGDRFPTRESAHAALSAALISFAMNKTSPVNV